ncbi:MAG: hypothetical protein HZB46_12105 [Solirubrobacterales bacterium]|nr:hypothetical protein [Solirubrobacterales bacterium]
MSTHAYGTGDEHVSDWVAFAGVMLLLLGMVNVVYGVAAIGDADFYIPHPKFVVGDLGAWGWVVLIVGAIQFAAGCSLWLGGRWGVPVGIISAGANLIAQLMLLPAAPPLAIALFTLDVLVLYGLLAHAPRSPVS